MCEACRRTLGRVYRAAGWCCGCFAVFFGMAGPFVIVSEYHHFGLSAALKDLALFAVMVGLTGSVARAFLQARRDMK